MRIIKIAQVETATFAEYLDVLGLPWWLRW